MKRILFFYVVFLFFSFLVLPALSQEIIIFSDDRSLAVRGHSEKNGFIYLKMSEGEFAVPKSRVKEIRKENVNLTSSSVVAPQQSFVPEKPPKEENPARSNFNNGATKPNLDDGSLKNDDDEDDEEGLDDEDDDDDDDDEGEKIKREPRMQRPGLAVPGKMNRVLTPARRR